MVSEKHIDDVVPSANDAKAEYENWYSSHLN
jgi:hypothetical protein